VKLVDNPNLSSQFDAGKQCLIVSVCGNALISHRSKSGESCFGGEHLLIVKEFGEKILTAEVLANSTIATDRLLSSISNKYSQKLTS
jgi:hypothetical protein